MDGSIESIVATNMSDALVMLFPTKALQPSRLLWIFQDSNFAAFLSSSFADEQKLSVKAFCLSLSLSLACCRPKPALQRTCSISVMISIFLVLDGHLTFSFVPLPNHGPGHSMSISLLFEVTDNGVFFRGYMPSCNWS